MSEPSCATSVGASGAADLLAAEITEARSILIDPMAP